MVATDETFGYKRNPLLPKTSTNREYTPEQVDEIAKCYKDPVYFAKNHFQIVTLDHGLQKFSLYEYQEEAINLYTKNRNLLLCASRQSGKTSVTTVVLLHAALFNKDWNIVILANKSATSRIILGRIKKAYEYLPEFLKIGVIEWNKGSIEFENGSKILAESSSSDNIRGQSVNLLYIDEMAFVKDWEEFSQSVLPTLTAGTTTKMIFSSTPNGLNHFYYYVKGAREKSNDFQLVEVPWHRVPGRDDVWKRKAISDLNGDLLKFEQEYNLEFQGSSGTLISGNALKAMSPQTSIVTNPFLKQFEEPKSNSIYVLVADVSEGKGLDYSAFSVFDVSGFPYKQVCTYRNNIITPVDYASVIFNIGQKYNNAYVLVESNNMGGTVCEILFQDEYENLLYTENKGRNGKQITISGDLKSDYGIKTTKTVKALGCSTLKLLVEEAVLEVVDESTIFELNTFSRHKQSWEAEKGKNDDTVMCLVLFSWLTAQTFFKELTDTDAMAALKSLGEQQVDDNILPLGFVVSGEENSPENTFSQGGDIWHVVDEFAENEENDFYQF